MKRHFSLLVFLFATACTDKVHYEIEVSGTPGTSFTGAISKLSKEGLNSEDVAGTVPQTYTFDGRFNTTDSMSGSFAKTADDAGEFTATCKADGEIKTTAKTAQPFGSVLVSCIEDPND